MQVTLKVCGHFDGAHKLEHYDGKCNRLHGHRFDYKVSLKGQVDDYTGMVVDFAKVKANLKSIVEDYLDHSYLNEKLSVEPTAENLCIAVFKRLHRVFGETLKEVEVWENPNCSACITLEDFLEEAE